MTTLGSTLLAAKPIELRPRGIEPELEVRDYCLTTAELAECTCPDFCERDHDTD